MRHRRPTGNPPVARLVYSPHLESLPLGKYGSNTSCRVINPSCGEYTAPGSVRIPGRPPKGFSLLEVLISLGLLGLVLTVVIGLFLSSYSVAASSTGSTVAGQLASNEMTRLKGLDFAELVGRAGGAPQTTLMRQNGVEYGVRNEVKRLRDRTGDALDQNVLQLIVRVYWQDTAVLAERGLDAERRKAHEVYLESQVGLEGRY